MTSTSTTDTARSRVVEGLRQLASYLDHNPDVPVDEYGWTLQVHPGPWHDDDQGRAEIDRIAALIGVTAASTDRQASDYIALRRFGLVTYRAVYITNDRMAAHEALMSYQGSVSPDPAPPPVPRETD